MNPQNPIKTTPKDFFLHLGAVIALYTAVPALINLIFSIINYYHVDRLANYFSASSIAWPISLLLIMVPALYIIERMIAKEAALVPEKKAIWIWRWRIYLTLFITALVIIFDLVAIINTYINGEIGARFVWKALAVLVVSTTVFKYYYFAINDKHRWAHLSNKVHPWFGGILVLAAIIGGFLVVGSPTKQRNLRFDNIRVGDLSNIQWQVVSYWQTKGTLPQTLGALKDPISSQMIPNDPDTDEPYGYVIKGDKAFQLCATFAEKTQDEKGRGGYGYGGGYATSYPMRVYPYDGGVETNWEHGVGKVCFDRTIDPERYPPIPAPKPL